MFSKYPWKLIWSKSLNLARDQNVSDEAFAWNFEDETELSQNHYAIHFYQSLSFKYSNYQMFVKIIKRDEKFWAQ